MINRKKIVVTLVGMIGLTGSVSAQDNISDFFEAHRQRIAHINDDTNVDYFGKRGIGYKQRGNFRSNSSGDTTYFDSDSQHIIGFQLKNDIRVGGSLGYSRINTERNDEREKLKTTLFTYGGFVEKGKMDQSGLQLHYDVLFGSGSDKSQRKAFDGKTKGRTDISSQTHNATVGYGFEVSKKTLLTPYGGIRYSELQWDNWQEKKGSAPYSYEKTDTSVVDMILGVKVRHQINPKLTLRGSIGLEHELHRNTDRLAIRQGSTLLFDRENKGLGGVQPFATIGLDWKRKPNHYVSVGLSWRDTDRAGDEFTFHWGFTRTF